MKRFSSRVAVFVLVAAFAGVLPALAKDHWTSVANLNATGEGQEITVQAMEANKCKIVCETDPVTIQTVVVRSGSEKTPITVAQRIPAGQEIVIDFQKVINVTGLRISTAGKGKFEVFLSKGK